MSWQERTWEGATENGDRFEAHWEDTGADWELVVTWTRVIRGAEASVEQRVVGCTEEEAAAASDSLDAGDDMSGWEDGQGYPVSFDAAADLYGSPAACGDPMRVTVYGESCDTMDGLLEAVEGSLEAVDVRVPDGGDVPEGLAELAAEFEADDWSVKRYTYALYEDALGCRACVRRHYSEAAWSALDARPEDEDYLDSMLAMDPAEAEALEIEILSPTGWRRVYHSGPGGRIVPGRYRRAPREVTGTGRVTSTGNSLIIKVTKECDVLGIVRGDPVEYTIRRI